MCFGFYHGLCADFGAGALGFELGGELRSIGFISVGAQRGESGNSSDGEEAYGLVHDANP